MGDSLMEGITNTSAITIIQLLVFMIIIPILIYAMVQVSRQKSNCSRIDTYNTITITNIDDALYSTKLLDVYVKTAYNCCCSGDFQNDYVDNCALTNCSKQGVRALHFDIYSLNGRPVISTSTVTGNKYKELYNQLDMYETMNVVKLKFMSQSDPLFLLFSVNSEIPATYESMYTILLEIFGTGNNTGNMIYFTDNIGGTQLSNLINKVVICVESYSPTVFYKSSLALITSLDLKSSTSKIYRETDILDFYTNSNSPESEIPQYPQVLFPNKQKSSINYDFVTTGIKYGITFTGMNFQNKESLLDIYNKGFGNKSFLSKVFITELTDKNIGYYNTSNFDPL